MNASEYQAPPSVNRVQSGGLAVGGIGLVLAIPLTAALKAVCDNVASLRPYGRLLGD